MERAGCWGSIQLPLCHMRHLGKRAGHLYPNRACANKCERELSLNLLTSCDMIRGKILLAFERAEELASGGHDFRHIDTSSARILFYEAGPRILPTYPEYLSDKAQRHLERLGVQVHTNTRVTSVDSERNCGW